MQTIKLLITFFFVIPLGMSLFIVIIYPLNVSFLCAIIQGSNRGYFINFVITRFVIEVFSILTFAAILVGITYAPQGFDAHSEMAFYSSSNIFRWCMSGIAIILPTLVLLFFRTQFVRGWRENEEKAR